MQLSESFPEAKPRGNKTISAFCFDSMKGEQNHHFRNIRYGWSKASDESAWHISIGEKRIRCSISNDGGEFGWHEARQEYYVSSFSWCLSFVQVWMILTIRWRYWISFIGFIAINLLISRGKISYRRGKNKFLIK